ncbi:MAG TPA: pentapeptide repeat-containing protein, partial [Terricaulis sp.]|nr:pentapeptide repeat-containing protein [Terricaulis sp.]
LFARARFHGPGQFRAAQFEGAADFSEIEAKADWWMRSGVVFAQQADFSHARFHAAAGFGEARFAGRTDFKACAFGGGASFDSSTFTGDADFSECVFSGALWMDEAAFAGRVRFDLARLRGRVSMRDMRFTREDAARAASALQRQAGG